MRTATDEDGDHRLVIYDLDGVITRRDTFTALVIHRLRRAPFRLLRATMAAMPMLRGDATSRHEAAQRVAEIAMTGLREREYIAEARAFGKRIAGDPCWIRPWAVDRLRRQHAKGARIVVATATERSLAAALLDHAAVPYDSLSASSLTETASGMQVADHRVGTRKMEALREMGVSIEDAEFVTDSTTDLPTAQVAARVVLIGASTRTHDKFLRSGVTLS
ncbi:haloacid dehalogenase-like hydrolase [Naumannella huperziae]